MVLLTRGPIESDQSNLTIIMADVHDTKYKLYIFDISI